MDVATGAFRRLLVVSTTPGLNPKVGETAQPSEAVAIERSREALFADPELWAARQQETQGDFGRRSLNMVVAVIGIVLTAPLMVLIGTAIKLTSRSPVIFRQHRIVNGRNRDTAWFSILDSEWPTVRAGMERWLGWKEEDGSRPSLSTLRDAAGSGGA